MPQPRAVVTFSPTAEMRAAIADELDGVAYLCELAGAERAGALRGADALLSWFVRNELKPDELSARPAGTLIQLLSAGVDRVPFDRIPADVIVASNAGAYAEPMAEHVLAMALALLKRLPQNHAAMARGEFDQTTPTRSLQGAVVAILGFGGIGQASARLFRNLGARIHAVNRSGRAGAGADRVSTLDELDGVLRDADVVLVSLPLSKSTRGLIGARELALMKRDAILINVARGPIVDEDALYEHLRDNPDFSAGIDAWWQEPRESDGFQTRHPFFDLPNLLGSPHNSGHTRGAFAAATHQAAANVARFLRGEKPRNVVNRADY